MTAAVGARAIARWRDPARLVVVVMALLAAGLQAFVLTRPHELLAGWSDISIYLGAAIRLVHGALPYRDFALLQPPGLVLLLSPFGLLSVAVGSRVALMALTACTPLLAAANVALVGRLIAHRGWRAALVACGFMAVYPATYLALQDSLLEPLMCLLCLLGAVLVFDRDRLAGRRRLALGGAAFGLATSVLIASALPVLVVAALCASRLRRRLLPFASGVAAGFLIPALPFFAAAPAAFLHDTVISQLARVPLAGRTPLATRLMTMTFAVYGGRLAGAVAALAAIGVLILVGLVVGRRRLTALDAFAIGATLTLGAAQFAISDYFVHFPAMLVPYPALLLGIAVARLRWEWMQRLVVVVAGVAVAWLAVAQAALIATESIVDVAPWVDTVVPVNGCSISPYTYVLVTSDRLQSTVAGCTAFTDPQATRLASLGSPGGAVPAYRSALEHTDYLVLTTTLRQWLSGPFAPLYGYVAGNFQPHHSGPLTIYVRDGFPVA
ncbi:MAG: glycosyltransferase 87 family protein [Candidatus Dormiibacterota bacterium]